MDIQQTNARKPSWDPPQWLFEGLGLVILATLFLLVGGTLLFFHSFPHDFFFQLCLVTVAAALSGTARRETRILGCAALVCAFTFLGAAAGAHSLAFGSALYAVLLGHASSALRTMLFVGVGSAAALTTGMAVSAGIEARPSAAVPPVLWVLLLLFTVILWSLLVLEDRRRQNEAWATRVNETQGALEESQQEARMARFEQQRLSDQLTRLEQLQQVADMATTTARDLGQHLKLIASGAAYLCEHARITERDTDQEVVCGQILEACRAGADLTQGLLAARESHRYRQVVELHRELRAMKRRLIRVAPPNIEVRIRSAEVESTIRADRTHIHQALMNLCINAIEAMPEGGCLTLGLQQPSSSSVRITVTDTGPGMPAKVLRRVFDPFFTTKGATDSGLGLTTAKAVVESHGGTIAIHSTPGEGTTVSIEFSTSLTAQAISSGTFTRLSDHEAPTHLQERKA